MGVVGKRVGVALAVEFGETSIQTRGLEMTAVEAVWSLRSLERCLGFVFVESGIEGLIVLGVSEHFSCSIF